MIWGYHDFWKHPYIVISNHPATGCYNNFSNHTSQHFKKKKDPIRKPLIFSIPECLCLFLCKATGNWQQPPPIELTNLTSPKKNPKSPRHVTILLDSSSHMSQLQWQGHRLPKTWRRRPGSSDPRSSLTWGPFLVGCFFGGGWKKRKVKLLLICMCIYIYSISI